MYKCQRTTSQSSLEVIVDTDELLIDPRRVTIEKEGFLGLVGLSTFFLIQEEVAVYLEAIQRPGYAVQLPRGEALLVGRYRVIPAQPVQLLQRGFTELAAQLRQGIVEPADVKRLVEGNVMAAEGIERLIVALGQELVRIQAVLVTDGLLRGVCGQGEGEEMVGQLESQDIGWERWSVQESRVEDAMAEEHSGQMLDIVHHAQDISQQVQR